MSAATQTVQTVLDIEESAILAAYHQSEKHGLEFGRLCYEYCQKHSAQGRRTDLVSGETKLETFDAFCDRLDISRATAYRWIARYKQSIGIKKPDHGNGMRRTVSGQSSYAVISALQTEIRLGKELDANQHAMQMENNKGNRTAVWNRLR